MPNRDIGHGDIIGRVAQIEESDKCVLGNNMYALSVKIGLLSKFAFYIINSHDINREMRRRANGTSQLQLIRKDIESVQIPIPSPMEQQKIADFLTSLDNVIEAKEQKIILHKQWKKGLMQNLFV